MSNSQVSKPPVFNIERNVIITANVRISGHKLEKFLLNNLDKFHKKTEFIVLSGHHHEINETDDTVSVGKTDHDLISAFNGAFMRLDHHSKSNLCKSNCLKCIWKGKKFENSSVNIETNEIRRHQPNSCLIGRFGFPWVPLRLKQKYVISETGKKEIKSKFEALLQAKKPYVLIFASCFSHMSEINHTLRASGLYSCLLVSIERSDITLGKVCHLDKEQQVLLQNVIKEDDNSIYLIKDVIIGGHFGTGKTMLAVEVLKIWMGRILEDNGEVDAFALTFDGYSRSGNGNLNYKLLNEELSSKYFQDQQENQVQVSHWQEFMQKFAQDHKEELTQDQKNLLEKGTGGYRFDNEECKSVLMTIAEVFEKGKRKVIVMVDEINLYSTCNKTTTKEGNPSFEVDFSYLRQYENVLFILCLRPEAAANIEAWGSTTDSVVNKDFELILSTEQQGQLYKTLGLRHRNAFLILKFLRFLQENDPNPYDSSLSIQNEQILEKESLPPLVEGLEHGVIWIPLKNKDSAQEKGFLLNSIKDISQDIKNQMSVAILYRSVRDLELAENIKEIKEEDYFLGPYYDYHFNGKEAEVVIYVTSDNLYMQTIVRARRLFILVTHVEYNDWKDDSKNAKLMNSAIEQKLVKKYQMPIEDQFMSACEVGKLQDVQTILNNLKTSNTDPLSVIDFQNEKGNSPLHLSAMGGHIEITDFLLQHKASFNLENKEGKKHFDYKFLGACKIGDLLAVQNILDELKTNGKDPSSEITVQNENGNSPLHLAVIQGNIEMTKFLLKHNAPLNLMNNAGNNPFFEAVMKGKLEVVQTILDKLKTSKRDLLSLVINFQNEEGNCPLHIAAMLGYTKITEILLEHNASTNLENREGKTPGQILYQRGNRDFLGPGH